MLAQIVALGAHQQSATVQRMSYYSPRAKKKSLVRGFNRGRQGAGSAIGGFKGHSAARRESVLSEVPSIKFGNEGADS